MISLGIVTSKNFLFKCATASVKQYNKCSQCGRQVTEDNKKYQEYLETLDFLFPPEEEQEDSGYQTEFATISSGDLYVTTMSGESVTLSYHPLKRIADIKKEVENKLKTPTKNQRLLYQNKELKV